MSKEKKENLVGKISDKGTENVSGGEIQEYRDLLKGVYSEKTMK